MKKEILEESKGNYSIKRHRYYKHAVGLDCVETLAVQTSSDYNDEYRIRESTDNGKTWSVWEMQTNALLTQGPSVMMQSKSEPFWDATHPELLIKCVFRRIFLTDHHTAYAHLWQGKTQLFYDHAALCVSNDAGSTWYEIPIEYEPGSQLNPYKWCDMDYLENNQAYLCAHMCFCKNGDIAFSIGIPVKKACERLGLDANRVFASANNITMAQMLVKGKVDKTTGMIVLSYSNPVLLSDSVSSVGLQESHTMEMNDGTLVVESRGCNRARAGWGQVEQPARPGYRWIALSKDGGRTLLGPVPMTFDDGSAFYSPEAYAKTIRLKKTGKLYWLGNLDMKGVDGMFPRQPLYMAVIDESCPALIKNSLSIIDQKQEDESDQLQLSNFSLLEDRLTGDLEIRLSRIGKNKERPFFQGHSMQYTVSV